MRLPAHHARRAWSSVISHNDYAPTTGSQPVGCPLAEPETDIKIVLADDHAVVRSGLRMLLDAEPGFEVVAEAGDADDAVRYVRGHRRPCWCSI